MCWFLRTPPNAPGSVVPLALWHACFVFHWPLWPRTKNMDHMSHLYCLQTFCQFQSLVLINQPQNLMHVSSKQGEDHACRFKDQPNGMLTWGVCSHIPRCQASGRKPSLKALWTVNFVYAHSLASLLLDMVPSHVRFGRRRRLVPVSQLVLLEWRLICVCYSAPKKSSWGFVFTTLPTWTTVSLCSWCKGGNMLAYVGRGCCFEVSNRFRKFALSQNSKLLLTSESWMAGATVPPEVLQDVSGCKLLASAFGFGLVQYDLVGCPSFSYIKVFETFWRKMDSWMHSIPVFKRFNRSRFALDMTDACCVRRNFCTGKASFPALEVIVDHPFRKKLFLGRQEKVFPVRVRSKTQTFSYLSPQPAITGQDSNLPRHADEGRKLASLSQFMMRGYRFWPIPHRFPEVQLLARMPKTTPLCLLSPSIWTSEVGKLTKRDCSKKLHCRHHCRNP